MKHLLLLMVILFPAQLVAHGKANHPAQDKERAIEFPDVGDYLALTVDLHTHSVFSDGHVWPRIRVGEALRDNLDALAITEHLEWQPHLEDIPHPDRNRAYLQALEASEGSELIVIPGSEITRDAPAGHMNAVFISDANALIRRPEVKVRAPFDARAYSDEASKWPAQDAVAEANRQGAFVFWNHPYWTRQAPDGNARIPEFHASNAANGLLHGIEIANGHNYSEEAFAIALEHDLTLVGVSDVHDLVDWDYQPHDGGHRPVTLVFTRERSADAIREALFEGRTVVWFENLLIGQEDLIVPLINASLIVSDARYLTDTSVLSFTISNVSDARFMLRNRSGMTFMNAGDLVEVPAHETVTLQLKPGKKTESVRIDFDVLNALTAPKVNPVVSLKVITGR